MLKIHSNHSDGTGTIPVVRIGSNQDSFGDIYQQYVRRIYRYLYSRVNDIQEAEDLTAQTFMAALESFDRFRVGEPYAIWLFGIARHKLVDHFRRNKKLETLNELEMKSAENDPLAELIHLERKEALAAIIRSLPEEECELLRLRFLADMTFEEISCMVRRNTDAVKKTFYRLLARMQHQLEVQND